MFACLPTMTASAVAARSSQYFSAYSVFFTKSAGGELDVRFSASGIEISEQIGTSTYQYQKYINGSWVNVGDWRTGSIGHDKVTHTFTRTFFGIPGTTYRVHCIFVCENSNGYGTQEYYSSSVVAID